MLVDKNGSNSEWNTNTECGASDREVKRLSPGTGTLYVRMTHEWLEGYWIWRRMDMLDEKDQRKNWRYV